MSVLIYKNACTIPDFFAHIASAGDKKYYGIVDSMYYLFHLFDASHVYESYNNAANSTQHIMEVQSTYYFERDAFNQGNFSEDFVPYYIKFTLEKACIREEQRIALRDSYQHLMQLIESICEANWEVNAEHLPKLKRYYVEESYEYARLWEKKEGEPDTTERVRFKITHLEKVQECYSVTECFRT